jgi:hypothetical protein
MCRLSFSLAGHGAAGERTGRGKLLRCSGPKKQKAGRPLLFGHVDAALVALTTRLPLVPWHIKKLVPDPAGRLSTIITILHSTFPVSIQLANLSQYLLTDRLDKVSKSAYTWNVCLCDKQLTDECTNVNSANVTGDWESERNGLETE